MESGNPLLDEYVLGLCGARRPKVCFLPSASGDADQAKNPARGRVPPPVPRRPDPGPYPPEPAAGGAVGSPPPSPGFSRAM
jgi:hypothetical protein